MPTIPLYIVFSSLAAFLFAFQFLLEKLTSKYAIKTRAGLIFYLYISFLPFAFILPLFVELSWPYGAWSSIWLHSLFYFIGNFLFFTAIFETDVSVFAPLFQLQTPFLGILAFWLLKERFALTNYYFLFLIILGAMLVSYQEKVKLKAFFQKPVLLVIASTLFYALSDLTSGFALKKINFWNLLFWATFTNMPFALSVVPFARSKLRISFKQFLPMFFIGLLGVVGYTLLLRAYEDNLTLSNAFVLLSSPIVLIFSIIVSRWKPEFLEHHTKKVYLVRALGVLLILISAIKLSMG